MAITSRPTSRTKTTTTTTAVIINCTAAAVVTFPATTAVAASKSACVAADAAVVSLLVMMVFMVVVLLPPLLIPLPSRVHYRQKHERQHFCFSNRKDCRDRAGDAWCCCSGGWYTSIRWVSYTSQSQKADLIHTCCAFSLSLGSRWYRSAWKDPSITYI